MKSDLVSVPEFFILLFWGVLLVPTLFLGLLLHWAGERLLDLAEVVVDRIERV